MLGQVQDSHRQYQIFTNTELLAPQEIRLVTFAPENQKKKKKKKKKNEGKKGKKTEKKERSKK